ncbi:MAG: hypothetical protein Q9217_002529 [Psora testacea]
MNACLSCLGLRRSRGGEVETPETSRLLYDDPYRTHYGTSSQVNQRVIQQQPDPEALRREREAMEGICHKMSDHVVDVFAVAPQEGRDHCSSKGKAAKRTVTAVKPEGKRKEEQTDITDEMAYKTVRRSGREPLSFELDKSESEAAKAALG